MRAAFKAQSSSRSTTTNLSLQDKEVSLRRRIVKWRAVQRLYMPGLYNDDDTEDESQIPSYEINLNLPSSLPESVRCRSATGSLVRKEIRLRIAQSNDALDSARRYLRVSAKVFDSKATQTAGTGTQPNTHMLGLQKRYEEKAYRSMHRYNAACNALIRLEPNTMWSTTLQELKKEHLCPPQRGQEITEGRRTLSWIWITPRASSQLSRQLVGICSAIDDSEVDGSDGFLQEGTPQRSLPSSYL